MKISRSLTHLHSSTDFGESHYIGPIKGAQPGSHAWVDGFPHTAWLDLTRYFAHAFKAGAYPPIERDRIYMWARPHLREADAVDDPVGRPKHWQLVSTVASVWFQGCFVALMSDCGVLQTDDTIWVVILATEPAEVRMWARDDRPDRTFSVGKGLSKLSYPMEVGGGMGAQIIHNGMVVAECAPSKDEFVVQERPQTYNFNAFVAMSS